MQKKSFGAPQKPRISRLLKLIILIILIELNIICSLFLIRDIIWTSRAEVSPFKFLKYFLDFHAPIYTISLVYTASQTKSPWKKLFHWKVWSAPALAGIIFSLSQWQFNPINDYNTQILGMNWQWNAIILWTILFILQLYIYQKRGVDLTCSFVLSFYGVRLAGLLYEIPWYIATGKWLIEIQHPKLIFTLPLFIFLLWIFNCRPKPKILFLSLTPVMLIWLFYYQLPPNTGWLPRLATYPFFLTLSFFAGPTAQSHNTQNKS
jgi:hypothetical protein